MWKPKQQMTVEAMPAVSKALPRRRVCRANPPATRAARRSGARSGAAGGSSDGARAEQRVSEGGCSVPTIRDPMAKKAATSMKAEQSGTADMALGAENTPIERMGSVLVLND